MSKLSITLVSRDYDFLTPLACGDVVAEGIDLKVEADLGPTVNVRVLNDPAVHAGETSFSRHLHRLAEGDRSIVGIPFFIMRAFRHRCFFVRRGSRLQELKDLAGQRVGTNEWPATGNTWSRAALREQDVSIDGIRWIVGSVDDPSPGAIADRLPPYARPAPAGRSLRDLLVDGEIDALMCPNPPRGFYEANSPIVRLFADFRRAEQDYYRRTGLYPAHHIVGLRREVFERDPSVASRLFQALEQSKLRWQANRRRMAETTPWTLADVEEVTALMGSDWHLSGVEPNQRMVQTLCDELFAQELIAQPLDGATVFTEFASVAMIK